jgi:glucarate dehydratase
MKITDVKPTTVNMPYSESFSSSIGSRSGTTRTIVEVFTDRGIVGIGETFLGELTRRLIEKITPDVIGLDPFDLEHIYKKLKMTPFFYGYTGFAAIAGIEMACWDIMGKQTNTPLSKLIGGQIKDRIDITGLLTSNTQPGESKIDAVSRVANHIRNTYGFTTLKLKGSRDWRSDVEIMRALADVHGDKVKLRVDPNWAWTVQESFYAVKALLDTPLEWLEDPTEGIEGMARLRKDFPILLATNMCVVKFDEVPPAFRAGAVDVILGDPHKWGGILPTKKLAAACEILHLGMGLHSGGELGISTAAYLQIVASTPVINHAIDSLYYLLEDDVITEPLIIEEGKIRLPEGPGLGIDLDREKLEKYAALNEKEGDYS